MKVRRVDFYPDEYISGVGGRMRADQQGVYWLICALICSEGGPIDDDGERIGRLTRIRPADARRIIQQLVDMKKLQRFDGKLSQKRCQTEIEKAANRIRIASENGANGGRPAGKTQRNQSNTKAAGFEPEKLTTNQQPATSNQQPAEDAAASVMVASVDGVDAPWRQLVVAFDQALVKHYGEAQARPWPRMDDRQHALQFLEAGATLEMCQAVFDTVMARQAANQRPVPLGLHYMARAVADAIATAKQPLPAGTPGRAPRFDPVAHLDQVAVAGGAS
jgi:uncharacterized protein YdaU (DUF1376 family)